MSTTPFVYLWTYTENRRNYAGWNLTIAREHGDAIIAALEELRNVRPRKNSKRFLVRPPTGPILRIPNNRDGAAAWQSVRRLEISLPDDYPDSYWELLRIDETIRIGVGIDMLKTLLASVRGLFEGRGDFSIGPPASSPRYASECLWFWPIAWSRDAAKR